jgi:hypothetical protein
MVLVAVAADKENLGSLVMNVSIRYILDHQILLANCDVYTYFGISLVPMMPLASKKKGWRKEALGLVAKMLMKVHFNMKNIC